MSSGAVELVQQACKAQRWQGVYKVRQNQSTFYASGSVKENTHVHAGHSYLLPFYEYKNMSLLRFGTQMPKVRNMLFSKTC